MKAEVCSALAAINQATEQIVEKLESLRDEGLLTPHFAEIRILAAQQNCAETNTSVVHQLTPREQENATRIQTERIQKEARLKSS
ncbi:MAG TPA: hypothetical protein VI685_26310 [Candidatus Angelobacter sp.]